MSAAHRLGFAVALALVSLGCDPGIHVNAHVVAADACASARDEPPRAEPIEGAAVTLHCDGTDTTLGQTKADGRLSYATLGPLTEDCVLTVSKAGYLPRTYRVGDVCATGLLAGHCPFVNLEPVLRRGSADASRGAGPANP